MRVVKWLYFLVLIAATAAGAWAIRPILQEQAARRAAPLAVNVYAHPFVSVLKETAISRGSSSADFFSQDVFKDATAAIMERQAPPFAKGADRDAWARGFVSELTTHLNNFMARRYVDSLQRLEVENQAKGMVLVRIANVGGQAVEDIRVEVNGGQLFMEGSPAAAKFRSLGTRTLRLGTLAAGEKIDLSVLTTQDMSLGGEGPRVKVSAKDQQFPVIVHAQGAPLWPALPDIKWLAFAVVYLALLLAGLGVGILSLAGTRTGLAPGAKASSRATATPLAAPAPAALTASEARVWRRPGAA